MFSEPLCKARCSCNIAGRIANAGIAGPIKGLLEYNPSFVLSIVFVTVGGDYSLAYDL
jgi:hypothetical protein